MRSWTAPDRPAVAGEPPALRLFDTADRQVRPVVPGPTATMYVCGITPYDATHLGHAATYLTFDLVQRLLLDAGHQVHYVQNITDVDDPLFERAQRDGIDWRDLGQREIELFRDDMTALRVLPPTDYVGAVETMTEVAETVAELLAAGAAYVVDDPEFPDVYHRIDATKDFGYESGYDETLMRELFAERGGDPERPGKRHPLDALLWRAARPDEPSWAPPAGSPLVRGRAGWHIECASIARNRLGDTIDIQGGGSDLIFPHHEFSAAHVEALSGERFARHYVHAGMIGLDGEKMSKSKGNLVKVSGLRAEGVDPAAIRLGLLASHYRADRSWSVETLQQAHRRLDAWRAAFAAPTGPSAEPIIARVREHLTNDLDTPRALAAVDGWAADVARGLGSDHQAPQRLGAAVDALLGVPARALR